MKLLLVAACLLACAGLYAQTVSDDNQIAPTTQPAAGSVPQGATQRHCQSFAIIRLSSFGDTFQSLTVRNNGTAGASDYTQIQVWWDQNDSDTFEPTGPDQVIGTASSSSFPVTISGLGFGIPGGYSVYNFHISVDVSATATVGSTFNFEVTTADVGMLTYPVVLYQAGSPCVGTTQTVASSGANKLVVSQQPAGAQPATAFTTQPIVELQTAGGAVITGDSTTMVTVAITGGTGTSGAVLGPGGSLTVQAASGAVNFSGLMIDLAGTGYTLTFTASGYTSTNSATFTVGTPQTATKLAIVNQPGGATPGALFTSQPVVEIQDAASAKVIGATHFVAVSLNGGAGGTLSGTLIVQAVNGTATFSDLSINQAGAGYSLTFSAVNLTSATSNSFNVTTSGGNSSSGGGGGGGGGGCSAAQGARAIWLLALLAPAALLRRRKA
ncbi:MAG: hypothetical protein H6839_03250 [Planctomycetes bacterium]|nr:hypothetical protein [Planctomycetota bacterium]